MGTAKKSTTRLKAKVAKAAAAAGGGGGGGGGVGKRRNKLSNQEVAKFIKRQRVGGGGGRPKFVKKTKKQRDGGDENGGGGAPAAEAADASRANGDERKEGGVGMRFEDMDADAFLSYGSFMVGGLDDEDDDDDDDDDDDAEDDDLDDFDGDDDDEEEEEVDGNDGDDDDDDEEDKEPRSSRATNGSAERGSADELPASSTKKDQRSGALHKQQLENLKESDPEFYKYLEEQDDRLLAFDAIGDDDGDGDDDDDDDDDMTEQDSELGEDAAKDAAAVSVISLAQVEKWRTAALSQKPSIACARNLLRAYRAACHHGDEGVIDNAQQQGANVRLAGADTYNTVMTFCLRHMGSLLLKLLGEKPPKMAMSQRFAHGREPSESDRVLSAKWRSMEGMFRTYVGNSLHLVVSMTDSALLAFTLRGLRSSMKAFVPFPALTKKFMRAVLSVFGDGTNEDPRTKLEAYLFLRRMAEDLPESGFEKVLNAMYRTFAMNAKFVNHASLPRIAFMAGCIADCVGIDQIKSYPIAFQHVRQMAIMLKAALTAKSADTVQTVYSWQFLNCADVWIRVLCAHAADEGSPLRPLVYPLVQVLVGVVKLVPTSRYTPLRLRCIKMLISLSKATGVYVPLSPLLLSILSMAELKSPPTGGVGRQTDWLYTIRLPKSLLRTSTFHEQTVTEVVELLSQHMAQFACHIAFPELAYTSTVALKHFASATPVDRFRKQVRSLVNALEQNTAWVMQRRSNVDFAPKDGEQVNAFEADAVRSKKSPLVRFNTERMTVRRRREATVRAQEEDLVLTGRGGGGSDAGSDDGDDGDEEMEERSRRKVKHDVATFASRNDNRAATSDGRSSAPSIPKRVTAMMRKGADADDDAGHATSMEDVVGDLILSDSEDDHDDDRVLDFARRMDSTTARRHRSTEKGADGPHRKRKTKTKTKTKKRGGDDTAAAGAAAATKKGKKKKM